MPRRGEVHLTVFAVLVCLIRESQTDDLPQAQLTLESKWTKVFDQEAVRVKCNLQPTSSDWTYQWHRDAQEIGSADDGSFSITSPQTGKHTCVGVHKQQNVKTYTSNAIDLVVYTGRPKPQLTKEPASISVFYTKESITLKCKVIEDSEGWTYLWFKGQDKTPLANTGSESQYIHSFVAPEDSVSYWCQVERAGFKSEYSDALSLTIQEPPVPELERLSKWNNVFPTESVRMKCKNIPVSQDWTYKWYRNQQELSGENADTLTMSPVDSKDTGRYTCQGVHKRHVETAVSDSIGIHVYDGPPTTTLSIDPGAAVIYTKETVALSCKVQEDSTGWQYFFLKDGTATPLNSDPLSQSTYSISSVAPSSSGSYQCRVQRGGLTADSKPQALSVEDPPIPKLERLSKWNKVFPTEGVKMRCNIIPAPSDWTYKWYRNQQEISGENADTLTMSPVDSKDTGKYTCQGVHKRHVETVVSDSIGIHVYDGPPTTTLSIDPGAPVIYTKETVALSCKVQEDSTGWQYFFWKVETATPLNSDPVSQSTYNISSVAPSNSGSYQCQVKRGGLTADSKPQALRVEDPPIPKLERLSKWDKVFRTEEVKMRCNIIPSPSDWTYKWYRNQQEISGENVNTLTMRSVNPKDTGNYTCQGVHRRKVETAVSDSIGIHVYEKKAKPTLSLHPHYTSLYVDEQVTFMCEVKIDSTGFEYWFLSKIKGTNHKTTNYTWTAVGTSEEFHCKAKRGKYESTSDTMDIRVLDRPKPMVALEIGWVDILSVEWLTLHCSVDGNFTFYTWYEDDKVMPNKTQQTLRIKATKENYQNEYKCRGNNTNRPTYSMLSEPFKANKIVLKRQILLAISGCLVVGFVLIVLGCIYFKCTRKPAEEVKQEEDLFFTMEQLKSRTDIGSTTDLCSPGAVDKPPKEEKTDSEDPTDELLKEAKGSQNEEEANGLKSFKGL